MKRVLAAFIATVAGLVLLLGFKIGPSKTAAQPLATSGGSLDSGAAVEPESSDAPASASPASSAPASSVPASAPPAGTPSTTPSPSVRTTPKATTKAASSKTVNGSTVSVGERGQVFGSVQVRVTLVGGKITAVTEVQVPDNDPRSSQISQFAIPTLRAETLKAQGAGIDVVSGATYTSEAYATSVQAALDAAKS
jgi:uncharacterized protein with FMN-binding domain